MAEKQTRPVAAPDDLPEWARKMVPVDMDGAALVLGVSRRFLVDVLRAHPHFEPRGNRKVFYPEHIARLREALKSETSTLGRRTAFDTSLAPTTEGAYERALALATKQRTGKPNSKNRLRGARSSGE